MSLKFTNHIENNLSIYKLDGSILDKNQNEEFLNDFLSQLNQGNINFILDLEKVSYMNSSGINLLVSCLTKARNAGGDLIICNLSEKTNKLLVITKLNTVFTVAETIEEAKDQLIISEEK